MDEHMLVRVVAFEIVGRYTLRIEFDDESEQIIDFEPVLQGFYFAPLRNLEVFNCVRLDPKIHTLVWPNDAAFDPATLYNWHRGDGDELARRAARWKEHAASATSTARR